MQCKVQTPTTKSTCILMLSDCLVIQSMFVAHFLCGTFRMWSILIQMSFAFSIVYWWQGMHTAQPFTKTVYLRSSIIIILHFQTSHFVLHLQPKIWMKLLRSVQFHWTRLVYDIWLYTMMPYRNENSYRMTPIIIGSKPEMEGLICINGNNWISCSHQINFTLNIHWLLCTTIHLIESTH